MRFVTQAYPTRVSGSANANVPPAPGMPNALGLPNRNPGLDLAKPSESCHVRFKHSS